MVQTLEHSEAKIERAMKNAFNEVGMELGFISENKLYVLRYPTWDEYLFQRWDMGRDRASQLITASKIFNNLSKNPDIFNILPTRESHVKALSALEKPDQQIEVWKRVIDTSNGTIITAKIVEQEVERYQAELARDWITTAQWQAMPDDDKRYAVQPRQSDHKFNETNDNIEWAAWSWNPITGCLHNCEYCYARDLANRFYPQKFEPSFYSSRLLAPQNTKVPAPRWKDDIGYRGVFVCSMADLFGKWVPAEWIEAVLSQIKKNSQWTFLLLTKFPIRMAEFDYPDNVWLGTTVDRQYAVERAEKAFRQIKSSGFNGTCWLSCEPMLERLTFSSLEMFDWVVMGGSSKSTQTQEYYPPFDDIVHLHSQARQVGCKIYHKTNLYERLREYPL